MTIKNTPIPCTVRELIAKIMAQCSPLSNTWAYAFWKKGDRVSKRTTKQPSKQEMNRVLCCILYSRYQFFLVVPFNVSCKKMQMMGKNPTGVKRWHLVVYFSLTSCCLKFLPSFLNFHNFGPFEGFILIHLFSGLPFSGCTWCFPKIRHSPCIFDSDFLEWCCALLQAPISWYVPSISQLPNWISDYFFCYQLSPPLCNVCFVGMKFEKMSTFYFLYNLNNYIVCVLFLDGNTFCCGHF